jgi:molybdenum cofactor cytidylyltransferase
LQAVDDVRVVVRSDSHAIRAVLDDLPVMLVENPEAAEGMASSIRAGVATLSPSHRGALIMLGDMPRVTALHLRRLIEAFASCDGRSAVVPRFDGRRGNPVLWSASYFAELRALVGDVGARALLVRDAAALITVEMPDDGVLIDVDTLEDWERARGL